MANPVNDVELGDFILAWQTSDNIDDAKKMLGLNVENSDMSSRASYLRQNGVNLKNMTRVVKEKYNFSKLEAYLSWLNERWEDGVTDPDELSMDVFELEQENEKELAPQNAGGW